MMNCPIEITDSALNYIRKLMAKQTNMIGFRLGVKKAGCNGYLYQPELIAEANAEDLHWSFDQVDIYIPESVIVFLKGMQMDYVSTNLGQGKIVFHNPNAQNECGCGESFSIKE